MQAQIVERAADETIILLTGAEARNAVVEQNFKLGQKYYSMNALREILSKLMNH